MYNFDIDEVYGVDFKEFCKQTLTTPDLFIRAMVAEIEMLERNYFKQRRILLEMDIKDNNRDRQEALVKHILNRIEKKRKKLQKYRSIYEKNKRKKE